ncbi:patatin-like protein [Novosphingobium umbonatum]|uniref:Patatin-like protein n=1 Tax=Novosphingobium umbonatum TaxID=1908524 RepID=A0A3S3TKT7_9SPHN|nr:patatin-like protein [Novosphingobium umbonatum]RVU03345.1 patatin-like protein [Novosphingobium umbonatum]
MRRKELRIALVCYGGISLAIYMHGVTKEVWHLARASTARRVHTDQHAALPLHGVEQVYAALLDIIARQGGLNLSILPDIVAGASAGGLNSVFLAQAIQSGQSLEPLTRLWLELADIDHLLTKEEGTWRTTAKQWLAPLIGRALGGEEPPLASDEAEVRSRLAHLVRARWFKPPFSGIGLSGMIAEALDQMAASPAGLRLLPDAHPLDLFTTATDYTGYVQRIALHSPAWVEEREHRVSIDFRAASAEGPWASLPELVFAARATASFPGAFPPLQVDEIDRLLAKREQNWTGRDAFLARILPAYAAKGELHKVALMDGSVLVNAPFGPAIAALSARPANVEVDRRLVYIDPTQSRPLHAEPAEAGPPDFFPVIFRALSTIPREQPIRDNLETLARQSAALRRAQHIATGIQDEVTKAVRLVLGQAILGARPAASQLGAWRTAAQQAAAEQAGYAYHAYALYRLEATLDQIAASTGAPRATLGRWARANLRLTPSEGRGLSSELIAFLRQHDVAYRQRHMRYLIARLDQAREAQPDIPEAAHDRASAAAWQALSLTLDVAPHGALCKTEVDWERHPAAALRDLASARQLDRLDGQVEALLADLLPMLPDALAEAVMLAYLGFAYHDAATMAWLQQNDLAETSPVHIDRISPMDWQESAQETGLARRLKGEMMHQFGAFFSRAYREHDYLIGRLHGAARLLDIVWSSCPVPIPAEERAGLRRALFNAILDEEQAQLTRIPELMVALRQELGITG